jgi:ParB family chromosome partitioning protein
MTDIPLNQLTAWKGNVRKTQNRAGIEELAASIKTHGLLQSLVVRKDAKGYAVVAGNRRLAALKALAKAGVIPASHPVPCRVIGTEANTTELSLAENVMREAMHPADEFEAFRDLIDKGKPVADVAAAFGVTEAVVTRRLKLGRVSPVILNAYREEKLDLEQVMAFAITDDHAAQERVYQRLRPQQRDWRTIRAALTENDVPATDKRVKYVTLKAYEKAGGTLKRDLFSDDAGSIFLLDTGLLESLVTAKLDRAAAAVRKEGWKWVESRTDFDYSDRAGFHRLYPEKSPLPAKLEQKRERLQAEYDKLEAAWQDSDDAEYPDRLNELSDELDAIEDTRTDVYLPEQLTVAGAVVSIGSSGKAEIDRGLVRAEDMPKKTGKAKAPNAADGAGDDATPGISAALIESLTAHRSAAISACLKDSPALALAAVVYTLALGIFGHRGSTTALTLTASPQSLHRVEGSTAFKALESARESWGSTLPADPEALWQWCLTQEATVLLDLLAFCAACSINAVQMKTDNSRGDRLVHAGQLARALKLDMTAWFTPNAENYYTRISKPHIIAALQEADVTMPAADMKKEQLARYAEQLLTPKAWLPAFLR